MNILVNIKKLVKEDDRTKRIALTAITSAISRVLAILVPLIVVRISLQRLGSETYGLWMAVTSFFSLFAFADLGLGSGLQTKLSRLYGAEDSRETQMLISCASIVLSIVAILLFLVFFLLLPNIDWALLMNAESEQTVAVVGTVVLAVVLSKIANVPLGLVQRVQFALQEGYISNLWSCASSVLSLVVIYIIARLEIAPIWIIWGSSFVPILVAAINQLVYFHYEHPEFKPKRHMLRKTETYEILKIGIAFMTLSILTTLGLSMDSYIIAQTCGLESVTSYSIGYRIATVMSVASTMLSTPLWAANGDALAKHDYSWVRKTTRKMSQLCLLITLSGSIVFLIFGNWLIRLWLGAEVEIPLLLMCGLLFMQIVQAFISPYFMVLNGAGIVKKQIVLFAVYTSISLYIKYFMSIQYGASVIPWIGAILYLVIIAMPTYILAKNTYEIVKHNKE